MQPAALTAHTPTLIQRLTASANGSYALDALISHHVRTTLEHGRDPVPRYTRSLDAALTLVPEGWEWLARSDGPHGFANLTKDFTAIQMIAGDGAIDCSTGQSTPTYAATPVLALCIAALKARATSTHPRTE